MPAPAGGATTAAAQSCCRCCKSLKALRCAVTNKAGAAAAQVKRARWEALTAVLNRANIPAIPAAALLDYSWCIDSDYIQHSRRNTPHRRGLVSQPSSTERRSLDVRYSAGQRQLSVSAHAIGLLHAGGLALALTHCAPLQSQPNAPTPKPGHFLWVMSASDSSELPSSSLSFAHVHTHHTPSRALPPNAQPLPT